MQKKQGFTLVEVLVVVAIVGVLATMVTTSLKEAIVQGRNSSIVSTLGSIHSSIDINKYPGSLEDLCLDFEIGGDLEKVRTAVEENGGIWNCDSTVADYRIFVKLNQEVILSQPNFVNTAFADSTTHTFGNYYCVNSEFDKNFTHWPGNSLNFPSCSDDTYIPVPVDPEPTPEPTPDPEPETDPDPPAPSCSGSKVLICHFGNNICVSTKGWEKGHSKHGDYLGVC